MKVYAGADPITRKQIYFRETAKTLTQAQIALGRLLAQVQAGKEPESGATVAQLLDLYMPAPHSWYRGPLHARGPPPPSGRYTQVAALANIPQY